MSWPQDVIDALPESPQIEIIDGAIIVNAQPTGRHALIVGAVRNWLENDPEFVGVALEGVAVSMGDGNYTVPDLAVYDRLRFDAKATEQQPAAVRLVVEVTSPSTMRRDRNEKREFWGAHGTPYLIVDPTEHTIEVYDLPGAMFAVDDLARFLGWQS